MNNIIPPDSFPCGLPWDDIIGYSGPLEPYMQLACAKTTSNCDPEVACVASPPVCSTCCAKVNSTEGITDDEKQAGNDFCRSLKTPANDPAWALECDAEGMNEDGTEKTVCLPPGDVSWQKEAATVAVKKIMSAVAEVRTKMSDLETWKKTVDGCILENGKCKTEDDNNKTMNMANLAFGLSLLCLVFLIIFLFVKKK